MGERLFAVLDDKYRAEHPWTSMARSEKFNPRKAIEKYRVKPPWSIIEIVDKAQERQFDIMIELGISPKSIDIQRPVFVNYKNRDKLMTMGQGIFSIQGHLLHNTRIPVVYLGEALDLLEIARTIYHEMTHGVAYQSIIARLDGNDQFKTSKGRIGFGIYNSAIAPEHKPKYSSFLEEAFCDYEALAFQEELMRHPQFADEITTRQQIVDNFARIGFINKEGKVIFPGDGLKLEPKYCIFCVEENGGILKRKRDAVIGCGLAGFGAKFLDVLFSTIGVDEKNTVLKLIRLARFDPRTHTKLLAAKMDALWGKGTYDKIRRCPYKIEAIVALTNEFEEKYAP